MCGLCHVLKLDMWVVGVCLWCWCIILLHPPLYECVGVLGDVVSQVCHVGGVGGCVSNTFWCYVAWVFVLLGVCGG